MSNDLLNHKIDVTFELLTDSYTFLFEAATKKGHWDEIRSTALAAMCLELREEGSSRWIDEVKAWMQEQQLGNGPVSGSWGEEIWDTALCIIALKELQVPSRDKSVESGLNWIGKLFSVNGRNNWHDEPWETSWALLAILRAGRTPRGVDVGAAIEWLASLQDESGKIIAPHYTAYFVLINHFSPKVPLDDRIGKLLKLRTQKCQSYLIDALRISNAEHLWTGEAWSNGQILWCLCSSGRFPATDDELVGKTIGWFKENQTPDGYWSDIEDTASATLGLAALLKNLLEHKELTARKPKDVDQEFERKLRKAVRVPKLSTPRHLFERDPETGYITINLKESTTRFVLAVLGGAIALIGFLANLDAIGSFLERLGSFWKR